MIRTIYKISTYTLLLLALYFILQVIGMYVLYKGGNTRFYGQEYIMNDIDINTFRYKYKLICDSIDTTNSFRYPTSKKEVFDFIEDCDSGAWCDFYIEEIDTKVHFFVRKSFPIYILLSSFTHSFNPLEEKEWHYDVNSINTPLFYNVKVINAFENTILRKIGRFKRNRLQGWITYYTSSFDFHFVVYIKVLVLVLLLRLILWRIIKKRSHLTKTNEYDEKEAN